MKKILSHKLVAVLSITFVILFLMLPFFANSLLWPFVPFTMYNEHNPSFIDYIEVYGYDERNEKQKLNYLNVLGMRQAGNAYKAIFYIKNNRPAHFPKLLKFFKDRGGEQIGLKLKKIEIYKVTVAVLNEQQRIYSSPKSELIGELSD